MTGIMLIFRSDDMVVEKSNKSKEMDRDIGISNVENSRSISNLFFLELSFPAVLVSNMGKPKDAIEPKKFRKSIKITTSPYRASGSSFNARVLKIKPPALESKIPVNIRNPSL